MASEDTVKQVEAIREEQEALMNRLQDLQDQGRLTALDCGMVLSRMEHTLDDLDNLIDEVK